MFELRLLLPIRISMHSPSVSVCCTCALTTRNIQHTVHVLQCACIEDEYIEQSDEEEVTQVKHEAVVQGQVHAKF